MARVIRYSLFAILYSWGCTAESTRLAIETQRRVAEIEQALVERQHDAVCILLYRDLVRRLEESGARLNETQRAALNEAWNDRDLAEFWLVQHERAKALRLVGVDAKLYGSQSILDLLLKSIAAKAERVRQGYAAAQLGELTTTATPLGDRGTGK